MVETNMTNTSEKFNPIAFLQEIAEQNPDELRKALVQEIAERSVVRNPETGYVYCEALNQRVDPSILWRSAWVTSRLFLDKLPPELKPTVVVGVSDRGKYFAGALASLNGLDLAESKRKEGGSVDGAGQFTTSRAYYDEARGCYVVTNVPSFTYGVNYHHELYGLREGDVVVVADDFCAHGNITHCLSALEDQGITPVFAYQAAKDFTQLNPPQVGYRRILGQKIPAFAIARFTGYDEDGKVIATAEDIDLESL